jgi:glycosyltransferase involved in cell wall biosynthesis
MAIRLHILALPHTITNDEFSHCAYTGKVLRFPEMMVSRGFEVYHYGVEGSTTKATKNVELLTRVEWDELRVNSYMMLHPEISRENAEKHLKDHTSFVGDLGNWSTPLYQTFNDRLRPLLIQNYRSPKTDIVCLPFGISHDRALDGLQMIVCESGIGYNDSVRPYRIFESYAWMHHELAKAGKWGQNYWFVVPNYFDSRHWPLSLTPKINTVGFFGRIYEGKGCHIVVEIARRMPHVRFILCGQGNPKQYLVEPNIEYKPPISGLERGEYIGSLCALLAPTMFIEPFCGVAVESQLCGTPVMTQDYGAQTETVEAFKTGLLCHTLQDYVMGVQLAIDGKFDRSYIRERAVRLYDMFNVGKKYEYAFKSIMDVHNGTNGWYSTQSHLVSPKTLPHVLYINLDSRTDRRENVESQLSSVGLQFERFPAILHKNGAVGCSLSHLRCLERAKEQNLPSVMIVEDDLVWTKQPHEIRAAIESLETVDYTVAVLCPSFSSPNATRVNGQFVNGTTCQTTLAYICKQESYDTLIANYKEGIEKLTDGEEYEKFGLDQYWKRLQSSGWVFAYPTLGRQNSGFSDILKTDVDYSGAYDQMLCINSH